jgi:hypothetical protein
VFPVQPGGQSQERLWEDQVMPGLSVNANVPSRRTVCLCTGRFRTCPFGLASRSITIPCDHTADEVFFLT